MMNKINQVFHILLFPIKDTTFYNFFHLLESNISENEGEIDDIQMKRRKENNDKRLQLIRDNMVLKCNTKSFDEIDLLFQKYYNTEKVGSSIIQQCIDNIFKISKSLISLRNGQITLKHWKSSCDEELFGPYSETEKAAIYHSLNHVISPDIFVAAHYIDNNIFDTKQLYGVYQNINLTDAPLDDVLSRGVSENHVHASAAFNFQTLWQIVINRKQTKNYFDRFHANCFSNPHFSQHTEEYILTAEIMRLLLAKYLYEVYHSNEKKSVTDWIQEIFQDDAEQKKKLLHCLFSSDDKSFLTPLDAKEMVEFLKNQFMLFETKASDDIIFDIFNKHIKTYGENIFLLYAFRFIRDHEMQSILKPFSVIFFRYLMIKNEFYSQVVQSYNIKGLNYFQEYFDRATHAISHKSAFYKTLLRTMFQDQYLKKIELRISFPEKIHLLKYKIAQILSSYWEVLQEDYFYKNSDTFESFPKLGIVFHLIKEADKTENDKCWRAYNNMNVAKHFLKFKELQDKYILQVEKLAKVRREIPYLADFIVGIDAASLENNTPIQVFAPVFEKARDSIIDGRNFTDKDGNIARIKSLHFTFHAGEDFRHINSGMRRIDELLEFCKFHSGDRIGHGIVLGVNIDDWSKNNPVVILPRGEYLDNLLWIWGVYAESESLNQTTCIYLEHKILKVAQEIFDNMTGITIYELYECYKKRFEPVDENELSIYCREDCDKQVHQSNANTIFCAVVKKDDCIFWNAKKLRLAYHCKHYLVKMYEPIFVRTDRQEKEIAIDMQKYLIHKLSAKGIVIEVNPSSNAQISELNETNKNQIFSINHPVDLNFDNIIACINSDDPIVFNTIVSNEMAYLYYDILNSGYSKEAALQWIEKIRRAGIETSFIDINISGQEYCRRLKLVLDQLCP